MDPDQSERGDGGQPLPGEVPLAEAARRMNLPPDSLSKRLRRKQTRGVKRLGRWYVLESELPPATPPDQSEARPDPSGSQPDQSAHADDVVAQLREEVGHLREELRETYGALRRSQEGEAELRRLIAGSVGNVELLARALPIAGPVQPEEPDLSVQSEPSPPSEPVRAEPDPSENGTGPVQKTWWQRLFGL